ncbi:hypothetical protein NE237_016063 [Protea cynaroides]|uniref:Uncharacterized protein n=1 Tax=Protea cynaroides TaxID=273540 RepID=A0A9Q0KF67_9MAGN|nr:hypothetical protein NE237_016063 [Protea cynaroides]
MGRAYPSREKKIDWLPSEYSAERGTLKGSFRLSPLPSVQFCSSGHHSPVRNCLNRMLFAVHGELLFVALSSSRDLWLSLPVLPSEIRRLAHFGVISAVGKLFVLGGGCDDVDPSTGDHYGIFATDEVIVAGGFTSYRKSISNAEIYDLQTDVWVPIPDLSQIHNSACSRVVIGGKLHVLHKGLSAMQVLDNVGGEWTVEDYGWLLGPMAIVRGELYVLSHGVILKQDKEQRLRKMVAAAPASALYFESRIGWVWNDWIRR